MADETTHSHGEQGGVVYRIVVLTVTALAVGCVASLAAIAFVDGVTWLNDVLLISPRARVQVDEVGWLVPVATVAVPTAGGLIVGLLLTWFSDRKRPLGPPDVIQAVQLRNSLPGVKAGVVSTAAAAVSLGFGASVGQYGPMVYLGAMVGDLAARLRLRGSAIAAAAFGTHGLEGQVAAEAITARQLNAFETCYGS